MFVDLLWLAEFLELVSQIKGIYDQLQELATAGEDPPNVAELTLEERQQILKDCTLLVARLNLDLACYPLTASSVVFVDAEGHWID